jgi:hypothetical protein
LLKAYAPALLVSTLAPTWASAFAPLPPTALSAPGLKICTVAPLMPSSPLSRKPLLLASFHTRFPTLTHGETEQGSVAMVNTPDASVAKEASVTPEV